MARRSRSLFWILPALCCGGIWWFFGRQQRLDDGRGALEATMTGASLPVRSEADLQAPGSAAGQQSAGESGHADLTEASDRRELLLETEASPKIAVQTFIEGEVLALDYRGQALEPQDGEVSLKLVGGQDPRFPRELSFTAKVEAGRFRHALDVSTEELAAYPQFDFLWALLGGEPATVPMGTTSGLSRLKSFDPQAPLRLVLVRMPGHRIEVFAAESGAALPEAFVLSEQEASKALELGAAPAPPALPQGPLRVPMDQSKAIRQEIPVFVGAPSRVTKRVTVDITTSGPTRVELVRGASLEVTWPGLTATGLLFLCIGRSEPRKIPMRPGDPPLLLEGLPPGSVQLLGRLRRFPEGEPKALASAMGTLVAGETARLALKEDQGAALALTQVDGRVRIAREWQLESVSISGNPRFSEDQYALHRAVLQAGWIWLENDLPLVAEGDWLTGAFRMEFVPAGDFYLHLRGFPFITMVNVPQEGLVGLELVVGPPQEVRLGFVDRESLEPVQAMSCTCNELEVVATRSLGAVPGVVRVPPGSLKLWARFENHLPLSATLAITPEQSEIILPVDRSPGVSLAMPESTLLTFQNAPGRWLRTLPELIGIDPIPGRVINNRIRGNRAFFQVDRPGRYRVLLPMLEEYRVVEPQEFELGPGENLDLPIEWIPR